MDIFAFIQYFYLLDVFIVLKSISTTLGYILFLMQVCVGRYHHYIILSQNPYILQLWIWFLDNMDLAFEWFPILIQLFNISEIVKIFDRKLYFLAILTST